MLTSGDHTSHSPEIGLHCRPSPTGKGCYDLSPSLHHSCCGELLGIDFLYRAQPCTQLEAMRRSHFQ